nr:hypothetical protein [Tanacetum cinerariifolium]
MDWPKVGAQIKAHVKVVRNMNNTQAQHKALNNALVAPADRLEFRKCNMRLKTDIKLKEATFQVVALTLALFYRAFLKAGEPVQISSVSSDFTSKLLNLKNPSSANNEIVSLMETSVPHTTAIPEITFGFTTTTPPPPPFFNPLLKQQTPTFITITSTNPTMTLPDIPNFAFVFKFDQRVSALESEMSELKQTNQLAEAVSSIPGIADKYLASKMKEAVVVAVQQQTNKLKEEAQAENQEFRYKDTQVYGTILLTELTNQAMLESKSYQTYYAFASGEKAPKPKYIQKKADSDTSPKKKHVQATKGTKLKSKAKVTKPNKKKQPAKKKKAKGLDVLSEVALTKAE